MKTYTFEDGKYVVDRDTDTSLIKDIRRHGEPWPAGFEGFRFAGFVHALLNRIDELEAVASEVNAWIVCAAFASNEDLRLNALRILEITTPPGQAPKYTEGAPTGTDCSICCEPQFTTISGVTCAKGHGGAEPLV